MKALPPPFRTILVALSLWGLVGVVNAEPLRMAVADLKSGTLEAGKTALLTELLRSELAKTGLFAVQDQPWIPGTKPAGVDKGVSTQVEKFDAALVVSLKTSDLASGLVDFAETATVAGEGGLVQSFKELTARLASRYRGGTQGGVSLEAQWKTQGAEGQTLAALVARAEATDVYRELHQYDGGLTPTEYLDLRTKNVDLDSLRTFLQSGVSYAEARRALSLGISRLEKFQAVFQPAGFDFGQYLDAYALGFSTAREYKQYLTDSNRDFLSVGLGGVANALPVGTADFRFLSGQLAWEHSWMKSPRDMYRVNTEAGVLLLNLFLPVPYAGVYFMAGSSPFFVKAGVGGLAEMLVGSHVAVHFRLGLEVASRFEVTLLAVPFGTEPVVNYANFQKWDGPENGPIKFPYFGLFFTYKFPLGS